MRPDVEPSRTSATLLLQAAPLMLVLFVLFPRVQGPVFGFPQAAYAGVTGLSDSMSPGDLASLGLSDEVAFRVDFYDAAPKPAELYWRGPVLWDFDGRTWRMGAANPPRTFPSRLPARALRGDAGAESHALAVRGGSCRPPSRRGELLTADFQLLGPRPVRVRERYEMSSHLGYRARPRRGEVRGAATRPAPAGRCQSPGP